MNSNPDITHLPQFFLVFLNDDSNSHPDYIILEKLSPFGGKKIPTKFVFFTDVAIRFSVSNRVSAKKKINLRAQNLLLPEENSFTDSAKMNNLFSATFSSVSVSRLCTLPHAV